MEHIYQFNYSVFEDVDALNTIDQVLVHMAREVTAIAYAPYSGFHVGCAARLANGHTITGTNQENASFPVGICAERALLATVGTQYPGVAIDAIAISYATIKGISETPISPCGMCRQALLEYETRAQHPVRLILTAMTGKVIVINTAKELLPLAFSGDQLGR